MKIGKGLVASVLAFGMIVGVGVSTGVLGTGDVSAASVTKKAGSVAYSHYLGKTNKHGNDAYRALYVTSRGIVDSKGKAVDSQLLIDSKSNAYVKHEVTYFKSTANKSWTKLGTTSVSGTSAVLSTKRVASTGTYYAKITTYAKDSRGKTKTYRTVTDTFYHSDK